VLTKTNSSAGVVEAPETLTPRCRLCNVSVEQGSTELVMTSMLDDRKLCRKSSSGVEDDAPSRIPEDDDIVKATPDVGVPTVV
jgi:hypothetical protein